MNEWINERMNKWMNEWTPALVFFRLWKWGLVNVFIAASNPTLLILLVKDTGLLSASIFNPQSQNSNLNPPDCFLQNPLLSRFPYPNPSILPLIPQSSLNLPSILPQSSLNPHLTPPSILPQSSLNPPSILLQSSLNPPSIHPQSSLNPLSSLHEKLIFRNTQDIVYLVEPIKDYIALKLDILHLRLSA